MYNLNSILLFSQFSGFAQGYVQLSAWLQCRILHWTLERKRVVMRVFSCKASVASLYHNFSMLALRLSVPNLGVGGGAPFSPFILNVIQTKPLTHMSAHISQLAWQFPDPLLFPSCMNRKPERKCASHKITVHKRSTQSAQFDAASWSVKGSLVWLPEKLSSKWRECVCVCLWECRTQPFDIHVVAKCSLEKNLHSYMHTPQGLQRSWCANWCVCPDVWVCMHVCVWMAT